MTGPWEKNELLERAKADPDLNISCMDEISAAWTAFVVGCMFLGIPRITDMNEAWTQVFNVIGFLMVAMGGGDILYQSFKKPRTKRVDGILVADILVSAFFVLMLGGIMLWDLLANYTIYIVPK